VSIGPLSGLDFGIAVGFFATLLIAAALDQFGDAMFKRGVARPFFVGKHRVHHRSVLFTVLPAGYAILSTLILAGYIQIVWTTLWSGLAGTFLVALSCVTLDLAVDYVRKTGRRGLIHHELIYIVIPLFVFSNFLRLAV
jgi:hypothetical protein